jgi:hypothetical protein
VLFLAPVRFFGDFFAAPAFEVFFFGDFLAVLFFAAARFFGDFLAVLFAAFFFAIVLAPSLSSALVTSKWSFPRALTVGERHTTKD